MKPQESARVMRRLARTVNKAPSLSKTEDSLNDLVLAIAGDEMAHGRLASSLPTKMPEMASLSCAFAAGGIEPPEMRYHGKGRWTGLVSSCSVEVHVAPNHSVQKVLVAGKPVSSWKEAAESVIYRLAMEDNGQPEDPEDIEDATDAMGSNQFHCTTDGCDGIVDMDSDMACMKCSASYTACPGCDKPYAFEDNEDDHCPMCGYSSWGELPEEVAEAWMQACTEAIKKSAETRQPQVAEYQGFSVKIIPTEDGSGFSTQVPGYGPTNGTPFEEYMQEPELLYSAELDTHLWEKNNTPIPAPKPVKQASPASSPIKGKVVVITGPLSKPRKQVEQDIANAGGIPRSSITRDTAYLVTNKVDTLSNKMQNAKKHGIQIIDEAGLYALLGG